MRSIAKLNALRAVVALACLSSSAVWANQIVLEGSDATALHHDSLYTSQLLTSMANGSALPVLVMGSGGVLSILYLGEMT